MSTNGVAQAKVNPNPPPPSKRGQSTSLSWGRVILFSANEYLGQEGPVKVVEVAVSGIFPFMSSDLNGALGNWVDGVYALGILPDTVKASADWVKGEFDSKYKKVTIITVLALDVLCMAALLDAVKVINWGAITGGIGRASLFGVKPLVFVGSIGVVPAIRVTYITFLALNIAPVAKKVFNEIKESDKSLTETVKHKLTHDREFRKDIVNIGTTGVAMVNQALLLVAVANPILILPLAVLAPAGHIVNGMWKTDVMQDKIEAALGA